VDAAASANDDGGSDHASAPGSSGRPSRADVVASYDLGVERYEQLWSPVILPAAVALIRCLELGGRSLVLDVGAGTGALIEPVRASAPKASVVVVDASSQMLRVAHHRKKVPAAQADAMMLPIAAGTVDAVVLAYVLFHLADPGGALEEARRVLRPGGRVGTVTWAWERPGGAQLLWNELLMQAGVPALRPRRVDTGLDTQRGIGGLLREAALLPRRIWRERLQRQWDPKSFWALATGSGVNRQRLELIDRERRSRLLARFRGQLSKLGPEDYRWEGEVICAVAAKPDRPETLHELSGRQGRLVP
jgi:SAM-dependent methyltransferase